MPLHCFARGWCGCALMLPALAAFLVASEDLRLIDAVRHRNTSAVRTLLQQQLDVNAAQPDGATALHSETNRAPTRTPPTPHCASALSTRAGSVTGTLTAMDVQNLDATNGIAPGEFAEVIALIRAGRTYVNVHSSKFPPGEIRSQIKNRDGDRGGHDHH